MNRLEDDVEYLEIRQDYLNSREWCFIKARLNKMDDRVINTYTKASDKYIKYIQEHCERVSKIKNG